MLEVSNLVFRYKRELAKENNFVLSNINFQLEKGYIMAVLGLNGSGKSTLLHLLSGIYIPWSGSVKIDGLEVAKDRSKAQQNLALISDDTSFLAYRTLDENARLFGYLYEQYSQTTWENYMMKLGFNVEDYQLCYDDLSTGQQRKFQLAFALAHKAKWLFLDEPTANLDPHARVEWMDILLQIVSKEQVSVIMSTHLTTDLDGLADYILVLQEGKQLAFMDREEMVNKYGEVELSELLLTLNGR